MPYFKRTHLYDNNLATHLANETQCTYVYELTRAYNKCIRRTQMTSHADLHTRT